LRNAIVTDQIRQILANIRGLAVGSPQLGLAPGRLAARATERGTLPATPISVTVKATAHLHASRGESRSAPESEQSSIRRREATLLTSSPAVRGVTLSTKLATARALQRNAPTESREAQLLAIAILRRDEALLDELIRRVRR
jgi:hypothetical protein